MQVRRAGNFAVVLGVLPLKSVGRRWSAEGWVVRSENEPPGRCQFAQVWTKRDGMWKLLTVHNAYTKPESFASVLLPTPNPDSKNTPVSRRQVDFFQPQSALPEAFPIKTSDNSRVDGEKPVYRYYPNHASNSTR